MVTSTHMHWVSPYSMPRNQELKSNQSIVYPRFDSHANVWEGS